MKVVQLRGEPSLMDLPGCLRHLADQIEAGKAEPLETLVIVKRHESGRLGCECFGVNPTRDEVVGILTRAIIRIDRSE
jgi:hypothetical protein